MDLYLAQVKAIKKCLGQVTAATFSKNGLLAEQFRTRLITVSLLAIFADALSPVAIRGHCPRHHKDFSSRETGVDFNTRAGLFTQPATEIAKAYDIVAICSSAAVSADSCSFLLGT